MNAGSSAKNLKIERSLVRQGWEIHRFANVEVKDVPDDDFVALVEHLPGYRADSFFGRPLITESELAGELVALDEGKPDFPQLCACVLMRSTIAPLTFMAFDVLSVDGRNVMRLPYVRRRAILDDLDLNGRLWRTPASFDDGAALWGPCASRSSRAS